MKPYETQYFIAFFKTSCPEFSMQLLLYPEVTPPETGYNFHSIKAPCLWSSHPGRITNLPILIPGSDVISPRLR